ncbi:hypothetical protein BDN70DRAFT_938598 [Pholiota conissans]|uniref:Uncharacterized protein n=1 Tax=Pholiota conissans TaxID=109636 RepID=A0A9P5YMI3_9AGAR|nr:hypothetical protein BDN70DRAFT_938598 [Pholiota conissans]
MSSELHNNEVSDNCTLSRHQIYYRKNSSVIKEKERRRWIKNKERNGVVAKHVLEEAKIRHRQSAAMYRERNRESLMIKERIRRQAAKDFQAQQHRAKEYRAQAHSGGEGS